MIKIKMLQCLFHCCTLLQGAFYCNENWLLVLIIYVCNYIYIHVCIGRNDDFKLNPLFLYFQYGLVPMECLTCISYHVWWNQELYNISFMVHVRHNVLIQLLYIYIDDC